MSIFEHASRIKLRFETEKGVLNIEDLWDLKLSSTGISLDSIAKGLYKQIKESEDISFVSESKVNPLITLKFDIVKHIIKTKIEERDLAKAKADKKAKNQRIMEIIERKKDIELESKDITELTKLLEE